MVSIVRRAVVGALHIARRTAMVLMVVVLLVAPLAGNRPAAASETDDSAPSNPTTPAPETFPPEALAKIDPSLLETLMTREAAGAPQTMQSRAAKAPGGGVTYLVFLDDGAPAADLHLPSDRAARRHAVASWLRERAERSQRGARDVLDRSMASGLVAGFRSYWIANALVVEGGLEAAIALALLPEVVSIEPNRAIRPAFPELDTVTQEPPDIAWGVTRIRADRVWAELAITGRGIVVANMDSGVDWTHPDLQRTYRGFSAANPAASTHDYNWLDLTGTYPDAPGPRDTAGNYVAKIHGTHVMGTIVGASPDGATVTGVAPGARWIAVKVFDDGGQPALEDAFLAGFQWLLAPTDLNGENPDPSKAPDVVCNSWGDGQDGGATTVFRRSIDALRAAGIITVFAAGNSGMEGSGTIDAPASYSNTLAIGATNPGDLIADFSSRGPSPWGQIKPDAVAPGVSIVSTIPGGGYATLSGTSMAAPHAAGALALMLEADRQALGMPTVPITTTERILLDTVVDLDAPGPDNTYGYGRVDAYAAVQRLRGMGRIILPMVFRRASAPISP